MKKTLITLIALILGQTSAQPFVYPANWFQDQSTVKRGGALRVASILDFKTFNPFNTIESENLPDYIAAGTGLFIQNPINDKFMPLMAESMPKISQNNKRFVVKIRKGMKFSDGQSINADDWITTYTIHSDKKVGSSHLNDLRMNKELITVKKINDYTLQFDFPKASALAYRKMSLTPWPDHVFGTAYQKGGAAAIKKMWGIHTPPKQLVTPGAWTLKTYLPGQKAVLAQNLHFAAWNKDSKGNNLPYLDTITLRMIDKEEAVLASYLAGDLDSYSPRNTDALAQIKRSTKQGKLKATLMPNASSSSQLFWITFNWNCKSNPAKQKLFRNPRFRRAISHLSNREAMVKLALGGTGSPIYSVVPPIFKKYQFKSTPKYPYNPKAANKLFKELGYFKKNNKGYLINTQGQPLEFEMLTWAGHTESERISQIFVDEAKKAGVKVNIKALDFKLLVGHLTSEGHDRKWDAVLLNFGVPENLFPYTAAYTSCGAMMHPFNRQGEGKCACPIEKKISELFIQGNQTLNNKKRREIGEEISKLDSEQQAMIYLISPNYHFSYHHRVGGWYKKELIHAVNGPTPFGFIMNNIK